MRFLPPFAPTFSGKYRVNRPQRHPSPWGGLGGLAFAVSFPYLLQTPLTPLLLASVDQRRQRVRAGSKRKRDREVVTGYRRSKRPEPAGLVLSTHSASYFASDEDKDRAKEAARRCDWAPFSYNATLLLVAEGEEVTRESILAMAERIAKANEEFLAEQDEER